MRNKFLVTGGTGKTGSRLAKLLRASGHCPLVATRNPDSSDQVRLDWADSATYEAALDGVKAIYLVAPANVPEPLTAMQPFIDRAIASGVERFVLLSASSLEEGGPMMGAVHRYLHEQAPSWFVLRPTWFMQNFSEQQHLPTIRDEHAIYSATDDGRVPFIDADDIAAVAAVALTDPAMPNGDAILTGPRSLSYDEVAEVLSDALGITIIHQKLSEKDLAGRIQSGGLSRIYAELLAAMDTAIAAGGEDRLTDSVVVLTGKTPRDLTGFVARNIERWKTPQTVRGSS
ncbi:ergot alkaloid biosynthesis protein, AFUA_2G17970 family [Parasphingorhabdus marina DSM 22363]|uniref:Ergot alkaloid biosynthesis protein, AFUA_2G17970 family n=1 Tax=Parasphingorhabdus marina DSM 22363 TaxID=1123272 RepID=A0A1N6EXM1_9SPHN|nr:ergot alkaloid biosynthesis protein [Parasphingorhabdus marina]SIN87726.1 ergot alkaloid biosynthesis protein, AFUA_2G17970 family [Parasphingorhabdus marina DSM 22363]